MKIGRAWRWLLVGLVGSCGCAWAAAQAPAAGDAELEYVVMLSRHGVRPPISPPGTIDKFSAAP